ncbi:MAG TPA: hypothetical protein VJ865_06990, partial [Gemmatimonadaceae bacterium]|nr:hypothetical protein [Gemmatimonadaceae bacterium]
MPRFARIVVLALGLFACARAEPRADNTPKAATGPSSATSTAAVVADSGHALGDTNIGAPALIINDDATEPPDLRTDSIADPLALVAANIDTTVTLGAWLKS